MNMNLKSIGNLLSFAALSLTLGSCAVDAPFGQDGEGMLRMSMVINSDVTRAETDIDDLRSGCVVYISSSKGLIHKYVGLENLPEQISMKAGNYVAEAWTGDSVSASWDKKFFRAYQPFEIRQGVNQVVLNCRIANVLASVNPQTIDPELMKDWSIEVGNSRASLVFDESNMDYAKAYFMQPTDKEASAAAGVPVKESSLSYVIKGTNSSGEDFSVEGVIDNVQAAHEYILNLAYNPSYEAIGGAFITVTIDDRETLIEDEVAIYAAPVVAGADFDIEKQITGKSGAFYDKLVKISSFGGISSIRIASDDWQALRLPAAELDLLNLSDAALEAVKLSGLAWDYVYNEQKNLAQSYVTLSAAFLNALPERPTEYVLSVSATDTYGKTTTTPVRIAVGDEAVEVLEPVVIPDDLPVNLLNTSSYSLTIPVQILDAEATNSGIRYREAGTAAWTDRPLSDFISRAGGQVINVTLSGLNPSTRYEVRCFADGFESESRFFTTESVYSIPNSSMELWSKFTKADEVNAESGMKVNDFVWLANADGRRSFWDSGNHGSATLSEILTQGSSAMYHSGGTSAELTSKYVALGGIIGKLAAGNLFAGYYVNTEGVSDGWIRLGRQYDGSHPKALSVWVNYRPAIAENRKGANASYIPAGSPDVGQIYIALATKPFDVHTKDKIYFNPQDPSILAYGVKDFTEPYGPDGALEKLVIPFDYYPAAETTRPLYLLIVCTASKYGDYFSGAAGSQMYLDDFELVYE